MTWLTWQGLRNLAEAEVHADGDRVRYVSPAATRGPRQFAFRGGARLAYRGPTVTERPIPDVPLRPGMTLYARSSWQAPSRTALAQVPVPVTLVSAFHDAHIQAHAATGLLDGTQIRHWFGVQVATTHPRLTAVPLGVDGRDLRTLLATARSATRPLTLYVNVQARTGERADLVRHFRGQSWATVRDYGTCLSAYYADLASSRFVLSPAGRGWDCYRTYEAILLGAIPIVRRSAVSGVVEGLPVLVVDDWAEVTPERLTAAWDRRSADPDLRRLTMPYWAERIQAYGTHEQSAVGSHR